MKSIKVVNLLLNVNLVQETVHLKVAQFIGFTFLEVD
jgi:hypothetical protein